jgi:hypothetical protein
MRYSFAGAEAFKDCIPSWQRDTDYNQIGRLSLATGIVLAITGFLLH